jgi:hypothetical protein
MAIKDCVANKRNDAVRRSMLAFPPADLDACPGSLGRLEAFSLMLWAVNAAAPTIFASFNLASSGRARVGGGAQRMGARWNSGNRRL